MHRMTDEIIDQEPTAAHPKRFVREFRKLARLEVMRKQAAAHQIEAGVGKGESQCVGNQGSVSALEVGGQTVEIRYIEGNSFGRKLLSCCAGHLAESGGNL